MIKRELVSVIILTWNRKEDLLLTLGKVKESDYPHIEIIVVDNGSRDGTGDAVLRLHPDVCYLYLTENVGIDGYNRGLTKATGEYIVFLDSDSYPEPKAVGRMARAFRVRPEMGAVAFDVRNAELDKGAEPSGITAFDPAAGTETGSYNGAGVGIRRECIEKAGDLFSKLFLYFNEFDHSFRIWHSGYTIRHFPKIIAYHKMSPSGRSSTRAAYFHTRNMLWTIWRYYPLMNMIPLIFLFFYHAIICSISQRTPIYIKACLDAGRGIPMISRNRIVVSQETLSKVRLPIKWVFMNYG